MTLDQARTLARERYYMRATPYRIGFILGEAGESRAPCPYPAGTRGFKNFREGVVIGLEHRRRKLAEQQEITDV